MKEMNIKLYIYNIFIHYLSHLLVFPYNYTTIPILLFTYLTNILNICTTKQIVKHRIMWSK